MLVVPGDVMETGLKVAVTPDGLPETENDTLVLELPEEVTATVRLAVPSCAADIAPGDAESERPPPKLMLRTGCSSTPLGAAPVAPCRKSNIPTPVTCTGTFAC
jgi:hypothetical protein